MKFSIHLLLAVLLTSPLFAFSIVYKNSNGDIVEIGEANTSRWVGSTYTVVGNYNPSTLPVYVGTGTYLNNVYYDTVDHTVKLK